MLWRPVRVRLEAISAAVVALAALPSGAAQAAKLVGGHEQAAVQHTFAAQRSHARDVVVSVRSSTASPKWLVARWIRPSRGGAAGSPPSLHSAYFHRAGAGVAPGSPPGTVRRELQAPLRVAIVYSGSGAETVAYQTTDKTICIGNGTYVDQQQVSVKPMAWTVRYLVDLDRLQAAVRGGSSAAVAPAVSFDRRRSQLTAAETLTRTTVDNGCYQRPTTIRCTTSYFLDVRGAGSHLAFTPGQGVEVGLPLGFGRHGDCAADDYTLGPSLWDSGAATTLVPKLNLVGGRLPPNPYAPEPVSWPRSSAGLLQGYLASPCQGISATCADAIRWKGTVRVLPSR